MLNAEGETLLYVASHGPFEKGKDVVTRTPNGELRAYQLKAGDFSLNDWQNIYPQITSLVELPVILPSVEGPSEHTPFFVTNGRINDVVFDYINAANVGWRQRNYGALQTLDKNQLVPRFIAVHGAYLPSEAKDFQKFLALLLRDGRAPLDKPAFSQFIESILPLKEEMSSERNVTRALASVVLLTSYVLGTSQSVSNHWAVFEGWVIVASYVLAATTKFAIKENLWRVSFDLAMLGANRALDDLVEECISRQEYIEGVPLADGFFYGPRQLIVAGLISAWMLRQRRAQADVDENVERLLLARLKERFVWGESAAPFILLSALELEQECHQFLAEHLVHDYLHFVVLSHDDDNRGVPDSFVSIEDSIRFMHRIGDLNRDNYQGISYTTATCIDYLARRWRKRFLAPLWSDITHISLYSSVPQLAWQWFVWEADSAQLESRMAGQPQSWLELISSAEHRPTSQLPDLLTKNADFLNYFALVFPHRLTPSTFAAIDWMVSDT